MTGNNQIFFAQNQEEIEKSIFGGNIYHSAYKFPKHQITKENIETFKNYTTLIKDISETCGREITLLFAEICLIYGVEDKEIEEQSETNKFIIEFCTRSIGHLSLCLTQSENILNLINKYENKDKTLEIEGKDYCFMVILLNNLFYYYTNTFNFIITKKYASEDFIKLMSERLYFITSEEFQSIRRLFKVVECYNEIDKSPTFH